jgi:hypothetical protein
MVILRELVGFLTHPFVWLWTLALIGLFIALPDEKTNQLTTRKNLGNMLVIMAGVLALLFLGVIDFGGIRNASGLAKLVRYIVHPYTIAWSLLVVGVIIVIDDERKAELLARDNLGKYIVVFSVFFLILGVGLLRLDRLVFNRFVLGLIVGVISTLLWQRRNNTNQEDTSA